MALSPQQQSDYADEQPGICGNEGNSAPASATANTTANTTASTPTEAYRTYNPQRAEDVRDASEPMTQQPTTPLRTPPAIPITTTTPRTPDTLPPQAPAAVDAPAGSLSQPLTPGQPITLGRAPDNTIVLDHPLVEAHHAALEAGNDDLASLTIYAAQNTWLNGFPARANRLLLAPGAELRIGPYGFIFTGAKLEQFDESRDIQ
ncbi:MAG: FHA domain-containing protein, partial [Ktedonobacterales bacterium]